jgi:hypothetical protein
MFSRLSGRIAASQQVGLDASRSGYNPTPYYSTSPAPVNHVLLPSTSWDRGTKSHTYRTLIKDQSRAAWYSSMYRLRVRSGFWTAAGIVCLVIVASAQYVWTQVLWPYVSQVIRAENKYHGGGGIQMSSDYFSMCRKASYQSQGYMSAELCRRTLVAWFSGAAGAVLCGTAIVLHLIARYGGRDSTSYHLPPAEMAAVAASNSREVVSSHHYFDHDVFELMQGGDNGGPKRPSSVWGAAPPALLISRYYSHHHPKRLPLRTELTLAILLSLLLGINAILVTGVQGPASKVGNLYYASIIAFLVMIRISLGCLEEFYTIEDDDDEDNVSIRINTLDETLGRRSTADASTSVASKDGTLTVADSKASTTAISSKQQQEKKRLNRVRGYFFLSVFSTVYGASAYDASANQRTALTSEQQYLLCAPCGVAALSYLLFGLSLSKRCYAVLSRFYFGGFLAILCFGLWLGALILTMHSESSWAVDSIGEIKIANLYYFAWGSIITAGIQMSSYVKALFGVNKLDYMAMVWVTICKVCFVILGAALHIWHTISDNCEFEEITLGAVTFCSRTVLAIIVALTGMLVGGLVVLGRIIVAICPRCKCRRVQAHVELIVSLFLVFLFIAAVALITGIGGPGQSVGDLFYSTWLAFWVSLASFISCLNELNTEEEKELNDDDKLPAVDIQGIPREYRTIV